jgi:chorismate mutase
MEFNKVVSSYRAASPAPVGMARGGGGPASRVEFVPSSRRARLAATNNSVTPVTKEEKQRIDQSEILTLDNIRTSLVRQEDSIIFSLLERAQFCYNADIYDKNAFHVDGFDGSLVEFMVRETEKLHQQVGRYKSPDEHPFFPEDLPEPLLPPLQYPKVMHKLVFLDI